MAASTVAHRDADAACTPTARTPCSLSVALPTGILVSAAGGAVPTLGAAAVHGVRVGGDMVFVSLRPLGAPTLEVHSQAEA
jgi:hypothetical protein